MIFAIKDKETVYLASTFLPVNGCVGKEDKVLRENTAIFKIPDTDIMLAVHKSTIPYVDKLRFTKLFEGSDGKLTLSNLINYVKPRIVELATEYDVCKNGRVYCNFIFVQGNKMITSNGNFCFYEADDYIALGTGEDTAIGSLAITEGLSPTERIDRAVTAVRDNDLPVYYPITIVNTSTEERCVVCEE